MYVSILSCFLGFQQAFKGPNRAQDKYQRLHNDVEQANQKYVDDVQSQQQVEIINLAARNKGLHKQQQGQTSFY